MTQSTPLSLSAFFESKYIRYHIGLRPRTLDEYRRELSLFERWHQTPVMLDELRDDLLASYLLYRCSVRSPATAIKSKLHLCAVWRFAHETSCCPAGPRHLPEIRVDTKPPRAWTPQQVEQILEACSQAKWTPSLDWWGPPEWRALVLVGYDTALRIGCLLKTAREAVDFASGTISTEGTNQKSRKGQVHALHPDTLAALQIMFRRRRHDLLFPWPLKEQALREHYTDILRAAGLPATKHDLWHKMRRTSYTQVAIQLGVAAATEHAGHSADLSRFYLDNTQTKVADGAMRIPRPRIKLK